MKPSPLRKFKLNEYVQANLDSLGWLEESFDSFEDFEMKYPTHKEQLELILAPGETYVEDPDGTINVFDSFDSMQAAINYKHYDTPWTEDELYFLNKCKTHFGPHGHVVVADDRSGPSNAWIKYIGDSTDPENFVVEIHSDELDKLLDSYATEVPYNMDLSEHPERKGWFYGKSFKWRPAVATRFVSKAIKEHLNIRVNPSKDVDMIYITFKVCNIPDIWETTQEEINKLPKELTISLSFYE